MGIFESVKKFGVQKALDMAVGALNSQIEGIGRVQSAELVGKQVKINLVLEELEDRPFEIVCRSIKISPDGSQVTPGEFEANKKFLTKALNKYACRTYEVPDKPGLRTALKAARSVFE